eukprot:scaffold9487_cov105-Isochrysis_galbana.AAC.2
MRRRCAPPRLLRHNPQKSGATPAGTFKRQHRRDTGHDNIEHPSPTAWAPRTGTTSSGHSTGHSEKEAGRRPMRQPWCGPGYLRCRFAESSTEASPDSEAPSSPKSDSPSSPSSSPSSDSPSSPSSSPKSSTSSPPSSSPSSLPPISPPMPALAPTSTLMSSSSSSPDEHSRIVRGSAARSRATPRVDRRADASRRCARAWEGRDDSHRAPPAPSPPAASRHLRLPRHPRHSRPHPHRPQASRFRQDPARPDT